MNFVKKTLGLVGGGFFGFFFSRVVKARGKIINPSVLFVCHYKNDSGDFPCYISRPAMAKAQSALFCP